MKADIDRLVAGMHVSGGPDKVERDRTDVATDVTVNDENVADTEVEVEGGDRTLEVQTGGLDVDVEQESESEDEGDTQSDDSVAPA